MAGALISAALGCGGGAAQPNHPAHARGHRGAHSGAEEGPQSPGHDHDFSDAEGFARLFDAPDRDGWQRPSEVIELLGVTPGATVADIGAGTGYFLPHLSAAVGPEGRVWALDVEPTMVDYMTRRIEEEGLRNVEARVVQGDDPGLGPGSVDRILIVNTWHHVSDRGPYAERLRGALRPGGAVLVVDFTLEAEHGPPPSMRLAPEAVLAELRGSGLEARVLDESLPDQYAVLANRR